MSSAGGMLQTAMDAPCPEAGAERPAISAAVLLMTLAGEEFVVPVSAEDSVLDLRLRAAELRGVPPGSVRLVQGGVVLADGTAAAELDARDGADAGALMFLVVQPQRVVSGGGEGALIIWDVQQGEELHKIPDAHAGSVYAVFADGRWPTRAVTGGSDGRVKVWDLESLKCLFDIAVGISSVFSVSADFERNLVACSGSGSASVWDLGGEAPSLLGKSVRPGTIYCARVDFSSEALSMVFGGVAGLCFSQPPLGARAAAAAAGFEVEGHSDNGQEVVVLLKEHTQCLAVDFARARAASGHGSADRCRVRIWDLETLQCLEELSGHKCCVRGVSVDWAQGIACSAGFDGDLRLWRLDEGRCTACASGAHSGGANSAILDTGSLHVISGGNDRKVKVWTLAGESLEQERELSSHAGDCWAVA